jgi:hypothetical protein
MLMSVKFAVDRGILDPEIGAQIDYARAGVQERLRELDRDPVRQREENDLRCFRDLSRRRIAEPQRPGGCMRAGARKNFRQGFPCELPRSHGRQLRLWMPQKEPHQLLAGVAGSADDSHPGFVAVFHRAMRITSRCVCNERFVDRNKLSAPIRLR